MLSPWRARKALIGTVTENATGCNRHHAQWVHWPGPTQSLRAPLSPDRWGTFWLTNFRLLTVASLVPRSDPKCHKSSGTIVVPSSESGFMERTEPCTSCSALKRQRQDCSPYEARAKLRWQRNVRKAAA